MIDRHPLHDLKDEDRAAPDLQAVGIDLMAMLREIEDEAVQLQALFTRWGNDPVSVMQKAQARTIELRALATQAAPLGETLMQACRAQGVFSAPASRAGGIQP